MEALVLEAAAGIGVPAAISFYVLIKVNSTLEGLTKAVLALTARLDAQR